MSLKNGIPVTRVTVRVQPNASRSEVVGFQGDMLRVRVSAPALEGKANKALVVLLAEWLEVSKSAITLVRGHTSRDKVVEVRGVFQGRLKGLAS